jgi:hypothetical protein
VNRAVSGWMPTDADVAGIKERFEQAKNHAGEPQFLQIGAKPPNNQPKIIHTKAAAPAGVGTRLTIQWPSKPHILEYAAVRFQELNAMPSDDFIAMIERQLDAYGLRKVVPSEDVLAETYREFRRSEQLREKFEEMEAEFDDEDEDEAVPRKLADKVRAVLKKHADLRWDDAVKVVLDKTTLDRVREEKRKAKKKSGDFTDGDEDEAEP